MDVRWVDPGNRYVCMGERIGTGAHKSVYRAFDRHEGREVAWCKARLSGLEPGQTTDIAKEIAVMTSLAHPHIVRLVSSWTDARAEEMVFVTDLYGSSVDVYLRKHGKQVPSVIRKWATQLCEAVAYLHEGLPHSVAHRDIKAGNVFVNNYTGDLALGDLGFATVTSKSRSNASILGTAEFMAPEVLRGSYGLKADVYALGMTILQITTLKKPYGRMKSVSELYFEVLNGSPPEELQFVRNRNLRALIEACIRPEEDRPSASGLLSSEFFRETGGDVETVEDLVATPSANFGLFKGAIERFCLLNESFRPADRLR